MALAAALSSRAATDRLYSQPVLRWSTSTRHGQNQLRFRREALAAESCRRDVRFGDFGPAIRSAHLTDWGLALSQAHLCAKPSALFAFRTLASFGVAYLGKCGQCREMRRSAKEAFSLSGLNILMKIPFQRLCP